MTEAFVALSRKIRGGGLRYGLLALAVWSFVVGVSLVWSISHQKSVTFEMALNSARANFNKDQAMRLWSSSHGGVYVDPTEKTPPSPWMAHLPDRDLVTQEGRKLTLMNPAYMLREVMQDFGELYGIKGRIVGIVYLNPNNKADPWEADAIRQFSAGGMSEKLALSDIEGQPYLRYIKPMIMEESCQKCHGHLGFPNGSVRGAVGVSVPMAPYLAAEKKVVGNIIVSHGLFWLIGVAGIVGITRRTIARLVEKARTDEETRIAAHVFANAMEGTIITNPTGIILRANPAYCRITGYEVEEIIGKRPSLIRSEYHTPKFYQGLWDSISSVGFWQGEVTNRRKDGELFVAWESIVAVRDADNKIMYYIGSLRDITETVRARESVQRLAHYDILTNLPNRVLFLDRLAHALQHSKRDNSRIALLFLDLDGFKKINDTMGHRVGDDLLMEVAHRLGPCIRAQDTFARLGGDEFTLILESAVERQEATLVADRILKALSHPFAIGGREVVVGASIGISQYPEDGDTAEALLQHADTAMYQAKAAGKNCYRYYAPAMTQAERHRMELEGSLREAIEQRQFDVYFQPKIGSERGEVVGFEALIRWPHPQLGLVSPVDFIPLAEEMRLIDRIDLIVLQETCWHLREWNQQGFEVTASVNLSGVDLSSENLIERMKDIIASSGVEPGHLEIELTESFVLELGPVQRQILASFKDMGLSLSIDDFGTGYSSLRYLRKLPVDVLKIDRSFVRDIARDNRDMMLISSIINLAHSLNLKAVAEGVETAEQRAILAGRDCDYIQGYLIARPMPAAEVLPWLRKYCPGAVYTTVLEEKLLPSATRALPWTHQDPQGPGPG